MAVARLCHEANLDHRWTAAMWWRTNLFDQEELEAELRQAGFTTIQKKTLPKSWNSFMIAIEAENV
jgi:hypothetical protein